MKDKDKGRHKEEAVGELLEKKDDLSKNYSIDYNAPLPQFNTAGGVAYMATDRNDAQNPVYAFVQDPKTPFRSDVLKAQIRKKMMNCVNALDYGIEKLALEEGECERLVIIFERPLGYSLASAEGKAKVDKNFVQKGFLKCILIALAELQGRKFTHRRIHPTNMFFTTMESMDVVLGECVTGPEGSGQPDAYEIISRSDTLPFARGEGNNKSDMFALGASVATLVLGQEVGSHLTTDALYELRIDKGSFRALVHGREVPDAIGALLRGLLADGEEERWGLSELAQFMDGHLPKVKTGTHNWVLSKAVGFDTATYTDRRALARAFGKNVPKAVEYIQGVDFNAFVAKSLPSMNYTERTESLLNVSGAARDRDPEAMVARVCAFLDPGGPIRFRGYVMALDGVDTALTAAMTSGNADAVQLFVDLLGGNLLSDILKIAGDENPVDANVGRMLLACQGFIQADRLGQGIERALYELNPNFACQSPTYSQYWILSAKDALEKLDQVLGKTGNGSKLMDRHFCAFIASRAADADSIMASLRSMDLPIGPNANMFIDVFGQLQRKVKSGPLKHLSAFLCKGISSTIEGMRYKPRRDMLMKKITELAGSGDLARISGELNLAAHLRKDQSDFQEARRAFAQLESMRQKMKSGVNTKDPAVILKGYNAAATIGMLVLSISLFVSMAG